jgi:hypothetical protein
VLVVEDIENPQTLLMEAKHEQAEDSQNQQSKKELGLILF